jgi:hypothetical protein
MRQEALSQDVGYDACVKLGVDHMERSEFSDAIAHLREQLNAVTYKRQLEARGETVHIQKNTVTPSPRRRGRSGSWTTSPRPARRTTKNLLECNRAQPPTPVDGSDSSDKRREPWYRRWFSG